MHIATIPNRKANLSYLLRETYREDGKVKNRTLANLSKLPTDRINALRAALHGDTLVPIGADGVEIRRALPHGHVLAALAAARTARRDSETAGHSLGETLSLGPVTVREVYATLNWLGSEQALIQLSLARRHLQNDMLVLYNVTSTYLEGSCCEAAVRVGALMIGCKRRI